MLFEVLKRKREMVKSICLDSLVSKRQTRDFVEIKVFSEQKIDVIMIIEDHKLTLNSDLKHIVKDLEVIISFTGFKPNRYRRVRKRVIHPIGTKASQVFVIDLVRGFLSIRGDKEFEKSDLTEVFKRVNLVQWLVV